MPLEFTDHYTSEEIVQNPDKLYVFGDNLAHEGYGGQAKAARGKPNAIGIVTKIRPSMEENAFFTDEAWGESSCELWDESFRQLSFALLKGKTIILPSAGIGAGRAQMQIRAPILFSELKKRLQKLSKINTFLSSVDTPPSCQEDFNPFTDDNRLMIVGEAPGQEEVEQKAPFVGRAGKLLRTHLNYANINSYYTTNLFKDRPDRNDRMRFFSDEITQYAKYQGKYPKDCMIPHLDFLETELDIIRPSSILGVGRTVMWYFLKKDPIRVSQYVGKKILYRGLFPVVLAYHPAYLLRNMMNKELHEQFQRDLQLWGTQTKNSSALLI